MDDPIVEVEGQQPVALPESATPAEPEKEAAAEFEYEVEDDTPPSHKDKPTAKDMAWLKKRPPTTEGLPEAAVKQINVYRAFAGAQEREVELLRQQQQHAAETIRRQQELIEENRRLLREREVQFVESSKLALDNDARLHARDLAEAIRSGDADAQAEAQLKLARATARSESVSQYAVDPAPAPQAPPPPLTYDQQRAFYEHQQRLAAEKEANRKFRSEHEWLEKDPLHLAMLNRQMLSEGLDGNYAIMNPTAYYDRARQLVDQYAMTSAPAPTQQVAAPAKKAGSVVTPVPTGSHNGTPTKVKVPKAVIDFAEANGLPVAQHVKNWLSLEEKYAAKR